MHSVKDFCLVSDNKLQEIQAVLDLLVFISAPLSWNGPGTEVSNKPALIDCQCNFSQEGKMRVSLHTCVHTGH